MIKAIKPILLALVIAGTFHGSVAADPADPKPAESVVTENETVDQDAVWVCGYSLETGKTTYGSIEDVFELNVYGNPSGEAQLPVEMTAVCPVSRYNITLLFKNTGSAAVPLRDCSLTGVVSAGRAVLVGDTYVSAEGVYLQDVFCGMMSKGLAALGDPTETVPMEEFNEAGILNGILPDAEFVCIYRGESLNKYFFVEQGYIVAFAEIFFR